MDRIISAYSIATLEYFNYASYWVGQLVNMYKKFDGSDFIVLFLWIYEEFTTDQTFKFGEDCPRKKFMATFLINLRNNILPTLENPTLEMKTVLCWGPISVSTPDNVDAAHKMILIDRRIGL